MLRSLPNLSDTFESSRQGPCVLPPPSWVMPLRPCRSGGLTTRWFIHIIEVVSALKICIIVFFLGTQGVSALTDYVIISMTDFLTGREIMNWYLFNHFLYIYINKNNNNTLSAQIHLTENLEQNLIKNIFKDRTVIFLNYNITYIHIKKTYLEC